MTKYIAFFAALLLAVAWGFSTIQPVNAATAEGHPYRGYATVCIAEPGQPPQCADFQSNQLYETVAECDAAVERDLYAAAATVHETEPDVDFSAVFICQPDENVLVS